MRNPGYLVKIKEGNITKGKFGIAYHRDQKKEFTSQKKVLIHVFDDELCQKPFMVEGKPYKCLKNIANLTVFGMVD